MSILHTDNNLYGDDDAACVGTALTIPGPAGGLEALSDCPPEGTALRGMAVVCHPHPLYGGSLHNKVVHYLARTFNEPGLGTVRFNFRGVGKSDGTYAQGEGETADLLAVLDWVEKQRPGLPLWLAGFSFGAYVALRAAPQRPVKQLVTVAPPVNFFDFRKLPAPRCPWLLIQGREDEVVPCDDVLTWATGLESPPQIVCLEGVGHFFHGRLNDLRAALKRSLAPPQPPGGASKKEIPSEDKTPR